MTQPNRPGASYFFTMSEGAQMPTRPVGPAAVLKVGPATRVDQPVDAQLVGIDFREVCAARLGGDAGRLAALHYPDADLDCQGCDWGAYAQSGASWPCSTAELALSMMRLDKKDIAITSKE